MACGDKEEEEEDLSLYWGEGGGRLAKGAAGAVGDVEASGPAASSSFTVKASRPRGAGTAHTQRQRELSSRSGDRKELSLPEEPPGEGCGGRRGNAEAGRSEPRHGLGARGQLRQRAVESLRGLWRG